MTRRPVPFIAERTGPVTYLPVPLPGPSWQRAAGTGVNNCGLVVGYLWPFPGVYTSQPVIWDPGC